MKVLIIGGVAGGASTAARLRRLDESVEITMIERGPDISFANCGLPYHIGDVIKDRDNLTLVNPKSFKDMFNVEVKIRSEAIKINRSKKTVLIKDFINNNEYEETYDKLVLSPGAFPIRPKLSGINDSRIFTLRNLEDMDKIIAYIKQNDIKSSAVIGGGFIGLEMAENLAELGIKVSVIELAKQVMPPLDLEMATFVHQQLKLKKVKLILNDGVKTFEPKTNNIAINLQSNNKIEADLIILSIGVRPESHLAIDAGLELGDFGGIKVDSTLQTSDTDIFALGDATEVVNIVNGQKSLIPLANAANKQGRIVAENLLGGKKEYMGTTATAIAKIFDLTVATTGLNEKILKANNIDYQSVFLLPSSHAGYYPNAHTLIFKLIYNPKNQGILGAQIIGASGVDKRIDVIAAMIQNKKSIADLAELELAYAPPYSSAKDPVNLAGMIALNQVNGLNPTISLDQALKDIESSAFLLDVRTKLQFEIGHIDGAVCIPLEQIRDRIDEIPKNKKIIIYCTQGKTAYFALRILMNLGYKDIFNLNGGYKIYRAVQKNMAFFDKEFIHSNDDVAALPTNQFENINSNFVRIDACGLQCPGPILKLSKSLENAKEGDLVEITTTDPGFNSDIKIWCERTGNKFIGITEEKGIIKAQIQKGFLPKSSQITSLPNDKTIVVFSKDFDRAVASFIIATGAASMGRKVTMFFTFWGLNILRKNKAPKVKKQMLGKMFGKMMPKGSKKLSLSSMNMFGMGVAMMRYIMKSKNVDSLESLIESAKENSIHLVACQMSMDVMGIHKEELIDGVEVGGVASYLGAAELADTNLFI